MDIKKLVTAMGVVPKDGTNGIYHKTYADYSIEVDLTRKIISYGDKILAESRTTQNFSQPENFVVLECIDRLLSKGYKPRNIILEKTWPSGHETSGRLDICVNREDGTPYLLIECKTHGKEFKKESTRIHKDGGQLFTYFQLSGCKADLLMLYASEFKNGKLSYTSEIIKIEDDYRSGDVKDIFEKWNKLTKDNGIFDSWVKPYNFQSKALTKEQLKEIKSEDSSFIFNRFLEILRHNVVSDKGNAFNKIFTLFLCKVYDETTTKAGEELKFQWKDGHDNHVDFQLRLADLYSKGMKKFLDRTVSDFNDEDFNKRCTNLSEETKNYLLKEVTKLRLEKNNEFAIKEVYDSASFEENAKVVKEVVELIQGYRIRYNKRQQYLSDFFELLLTTGLKQEAGQFFTPVPIAQFIIKSLPLDTIVAEKLEREDGNILPYMIDYAAGSGHFITEYMHEVQDLINKADKSQYIEGTQKQLTNWQNSHFDWATDYVYGIEKDYRLVKVGKVGCYLHGDGLANVILSDGLANFHKNKEYKGKLRKKTDDWQKDNQQFDIILSNPPYSVSSFRQTTRDYYSEQDFDLYHSLTDNSSEIECLFVERTKQLLKEGGVAGIILPCSILSNAGIYSKTREILLQYFEIIAIAELGGNTFMATNTNTIVLFLRRRDNYFAANTKTSVDTYFRTLNDVTINGIEHPAAKYVTHVWEGLEYSDYLSLLRKTPNSKVKAHEIYLEYQEKISAVTETRQLNTILDVEAEKLLYFILTYRQQIVVVKSGEKNTEKQFLGYEFSNRRGNEGIHAIHKGKSIDECTQLFDTERYDNSQKASCYIYQAFKGDLSSEIEESLKSHVSRMNLVDLLTFDRSNIEKSISTSVKKKSLIRSQRPQRKLGELCTLLKRGKSAKYGKSNIQIIKSGQARGWFDFDFSERHYVDTSYIPDERQLNKGDLLINSTGIGTAGRVTYFHEDGNFVVDSHITIFRANREVVLPEYVLYALGHIGFDAIEKMAQGQSGQIELSLDTIANIRIPIPPKKTQEKIVQEINHLKEKEQAAHATAENILIKIRTLLRHTQENAVTSFRLSNRSKFNLTIGKRVLASELTSKGGVPVMSANVSRPFGFTDKLLMTDFSKPSILWGIDGDWMVNYIEAGHPFYPTDHCGVLRVLDDTIQPKYLASVLEQAGKDIRFSRSLRASIDRIAGITVMLPSEAIQTKAVSEITVLEAELMNARTIIDSIPSQKQAVLNKYLQ